LCLRLCRLSTSSSAPVFLLTTHVTTG
jgi:hypothetical protein